MPAKLRPPAPAPRDKALGPIGLLRVLMRNPLEAWTKAHFEEPIVMGGLPFGRVAVVSDPAAIRRVLLDNSENYRKDWLQRRVLSAGLTDGLLTAEKQQWRMQRRVLAPLFAARTVNGFAPAMIETARAGVARLAARDGAVVDLAAEVTRVTLEVMEKTIFSDGFGRAPEDVRATMKIYFESVGRLDPFDVVGLPPGLPRPGRRRVKPALRFFEAAVDDIIAARRRRMAEARGAAPYDILTLLLEARDPDTGLGLSEREVRANVLTFIAAGHETTANCLSWSLFLLSQSPEWRRRVQDEADREVDRGPPESLAERLVVTRAVIDEANRLYPPIAAISRAALAADELVGQRIPRGAMIVIAPYVLHRHRRLWHEPDVFDPGRFLDGGREEIGRFAYLPFGAGPRVCIGAAFALQEAAIVLATMMRGLEVTLVDGAAVSPVQKVTLRPLRGLPAIVRRR